MSIIKWPNSNILANVSGLSTAICIGSLTGNLTAAATGGMAVYTGLSVFRDAMREVAREIARSPESPVACNNNERAAQGQEYRLDGGFADMDKAADRMSSPWPPRPSPIEIALAKTAGRSATPEL